MNTPAMITWASRPNKFGQPLEHAYLDGRDIGFVCSIRRLDDEELIWKWMTPGLTELGGKGVSEPFETAQEAKRDLEAAVRVWWIS